MQEALPSSAAPLASPESVEAGVVAALAYADVFAWPLSAAEIHRTMPAAATLADVHLALGSAVGRSVVGSDGDLHFLPGRNDIVRERRTREAISADLWKMALRYGRAIAALPFVKLVAVSGSLAVDAADADADIDLFIVTENGRLWTTRALVIAVVRAAATRAGGRVVVCPNFLVAESNLAMSERDHFTAHELAQLVPLWGDSAYAELLEQNAWFSDFLPNHRGRGPATISRSRGLGHRLEGLLRQPIFDRFERWEMQRKIARLAGASALPDARYDENVCKGHVDGHRQRILRAYESRLAELGERP